LTAPDKGREALEIKTGDTVKHGPTGETWTVAFVEDDRLAWCGWPPGYAKLADCTLVESCSAEESLSLIRQLAEMRGSDRDGYDHRKSWAQHYLSKLSEVR
jgi:hypothetical protein